MSAVELSRAQLITDLIQERRTPPLARIDVWADILDLKAADRTKLFELTALAHLPSDAQPHFLRILQRLEKLESIAQSLLRGDGKRDR